MPVTGLFLVGFFVSIVWLACSLERRAWASIVLCIALDIGAVYGLGVLLENRPYENVTQKISVVDNKPVIFVDDTIILLAKKTGEMYNVNDTVTFKYMSNHTADKYFYFGDTVDSRVREVKTVKEEK